MIDGWSLSNVVAFSAQSAVIVTGGALIAALVRIDAPGVRYFYWRTLAALCLALPWLQRYREIPAPAGAAAGAAVDTVVLGIVVAAPSGGPDDWAGIAGLVIAAGAAARIVWLCSGLRRLRQLRRAGRLADAGEQTELQQMLGTRAEVRVVPELSQPLTFGAWRPVVLVPASLLRHPASIQRAVFAHELLHVQRRDWMWLMGEELVRAALWFHPVMWWLISRVQQSREEVVDELAVLVTDSRKSYIEALLAYAGDRPLAATAAFSPRRHLFSRMVLISREGVMSSKRIVVSCAAMALVVLTGVQYAVSAFPMQSAVSATRQPAPTEAGPLERRAHTVTPENPVPRRVGYVAPVFPDGAGDARGTVTVKLTIDELGRVAESRVVGVSVQGKEYSISMSGENAPEQLEQGLARTSMKKKDGTAVDSAAVGEAAGALIAAALTSVRQWRYDPPAMGPLSFFMTLRFASTPSQEPGTEPGPSRERSTWAADGGIRVGGNIKVPTKIRNVSPVYPAEAKAANVQGIVIIEARIDAEGRVTETHVLRSIPLLDQAAVDAVSQWEFVPTLMNGKPVPVIMTVTVNFTME